MPRKYNKSRDRRDNLVTPKTDRILTGNLIRITMTQYRATYQEAKDIVITKFPALAAVIAEMRFNERDFA